MKSFFKKIVSGILVWEAKMVLRRYKPRIVAITGSVGKTSTKDAIVHILKTRFRVRGSAKSFNSEIGLPLTILGLENAWTNPFRWLLTLCEGLSLLFVPHNYPELLVLEVGADRPNDIACVSKWLLPDVAVIT